MTPADVLLKAERALAGARVLFDAHDNEGACSRAYYAMFDAARAALLAAAPDAMAANIKTHRGLIAVFGRELVLSGRVDAELGRSFNRAQNLRLSADYLGDAASREDAAMAVERAQAFIEAMRSTFFAASR